MTGCSARHLHSVRTSAHSIAGVWIIKGSRIMDRRETALCLREVLDHLNRCCDQWHAADSRTEQWALQSIERDLAELQRVCRMARRQNIESLAQGADSTASARAA
jgi:hypothetical protein